ncbi:MAG: nucleotidyltransferase domain-containing protein [Xanthomonadales bacterium]|nr:nucleotidyltransferase domain-containing protein [Xanthomonadales bacterium]
MILYTALTSSAQTAYAQLFDAAQAAELSRTVADLPGTFTRKTVKGKDYWYYQFLDVSGSKRQVYVGPESDRVHALINVRAQTGMREALTPLAQSAEALGNAPILARHFKVAQRLSDYGFFRAGGVLVGTHAFLSFGNMLGMHWSDGQRTQDVDFAHAGRSMSIALPVDADIDVHAAIESLQMGLLPIRHSDGAVGASYIDPREPDFQIDFLTPVYRGGHEPYLHPKLGIRLQPLKFMEYLLEDLQQAVLFCKSGACIVNVPHPARYALHKLIVAGERPVSRIAKSNKDILQAATALSVLKELAPGQVEDAWKDMLGRGPGWVSRVLRGRAALQRVAPELEPLKWLKAAGE